MCFNARAASSKARKTTESIVAFKLLRGIKILRSPISSNLRWRKGETMIEKRFEEKADWYGDVNRGFHSFKTLKAAEKYKGQRKWGIYKVTIPKGSLVHRNSTQYCSNQIRLRSITRVK